MAGSDLKRRAEHDAPSGRPAKRIDTRGRRVETPKSPKRKREDENAPQNKRQKLAVDQLQTLNGQEQASPPVTQPPPRAQKAVPLFFQLIQRKGATALPSQRNPTRTELFEGASKPASRADTQAPKPKAEAPKVEDASRLVKAPSPQPKITQTKSQRRPAPVKIHVPRTRPSEAKAQDGSSSKSNGVVGVPNSKSTPPAVSSPCAPTVVGNKKPEEATKHVSPAKRKVDESMGGPAKKTKTESPSLVATSTSSVTLGPSGQEEGTGGVAATLPGKRKAEESEEAPARKKAKPDPLLKLCGMVRANGKLGATTKPAVRAESQSDPSGDRARNTKETPSSPKPRQAPSAKLIPPAGLDNDSSRCFGNVVMHTLDSVPELRDHLISRCQAARAACEAQFPADDKDSERVRLGKGKKRQDAFEERMEKSLTVCVGRHLEKMATAAKDGKPTTIRPLLQAFGKRNENNAEYDGRQQQDAFDFFERLLEQLGEEEMKSGGDGQKTPLVTELFAGKTMTLMECDACQKKREVSVVKASSLQLRFPPGKSPIALERFLEHASIEERPEGAKCEACGRRDTSSKRDGVKEWGQYLVVNCNRAMMNAKIGTKISIPTHVNLAKHMPDYQPLAADATKLDKSNEEVLSPHRFEVIAFAQHHGTRRNAGHYTVCRKVGSEWFSCDDLKVTRSDVARLHETTATMILLRRD
ncbi:MAG: hypothetical protein LQ352_005984 [Teloschistes flavicans]|nr:MAG: hypothetical protein LQ352_005984 [Teloschistes flavicans]